MMDTVHDVLKVDGGLVGLTAALVLRHHGCAAQLPLCQPGADGEPVEVSPESPCLIAQDILEPVLRAAAVTRARTCGSAPR
ncbi:hypothetical protein [Actinophytocola algeriensis]|uniref:FAD binding domain-containing protein n=1 Tax=Actinophytocola algeriensis TaxID=1768010 RepID=A0A7W7VHE5_9PSEU|nr:hypothetical protein [Actinophytocola algeriensis]MBB4910422.1 hypothetical protein [Actinophytocola algeriensis]MBE1480589.1 hypothetical protein [Actinophytocola algeriensis]